MKDNNKAIRKSVKALGLESKEIYTSAELDAIVKESKATLMEVMYFLRYEK